MLMQESNDQRGTLTELELVKILRREDYTLNAVNNYGENLLHISVANDCFEIVKEILKKVEFSRIIDRKNQFGWTPLMLAIRNRNIEMTKLLLEKNASTNESTYLGMSVFGLAAAISMEMFEIVYSFCPSALANTDNDDITPLCIAAMRNDNDLFFRLLDLGLNIPKSNGYTQLMMRQSNAPKIKRLASELSDITLYWDDVSDNISTDNNFSQPVQGFGKVAEKENQDANVMQNLDRPSNNWERKTRKTMLKIPLMSVFKFDTPDGDNARSDIKSQLTIKKNSLSIDTSNTSPQNLISPTLMYNIDKLFPSEPNLCFIQKSFDKENTPIRGYFMQPKRTDSSEINEVLINISPIHWSQSIRSSNPGTPNYQTGLNTTLGYSPDFSPKRSPNVPSDINDENVYGENTPTPPRYRTPPRGMILNSEEAKMLALLRRFKLEHCLSIFLEQEVDVELFMTLTNEDLIEIGIKNTLDREAIIAAIQECKKMNF